MAGIRSSKNEAFRMNVVLSTEFKDLTLFKRGKVRDVYDLGDKLLIIATDRILF